MRALLLCLMLGVSLVAQAKEPLVAVAASARYVFDDLATAFAKRYDAKPASTVGASGVFAAQIAHGAPFDVFLSADMDYPEQLASQGLTVGQPRVYARGALVLWTMGDLPMKDWEAVLTDPRVRRIAIADPRTAPYGREAQRVIDGLPQAAAIQPKLVFGESIAKADQFVSSRAADIGFTARSVVNSPALRDQARWVEIPASRYQAILQGVVLLKHGEDNPLARQFVDFLFTPEAQSIFQRHGYLLP
ncbi:molybdate ABC transporter substrate-binding protein [Chitiniphilus eburneus]|uniref:Molybdate ABC transporter substrate-binding protein n=1 Tax=Chitiniphilus eburneus TaxID=2571148 RepID=A0A4U0PCZ8_9NEIS|nr:molybdate ABC transporter substrate-binding protein [Chitiniphilus eburneus]TJZ65637.1 molybdate ABC transporter substrate-binding protein [Chitiniphilus eburneus]